MFQGGYLCNGGLLILFEEQERKTHAQTIHTLDTATCGTPAHCDVPGAVACAV